jgi:hypothetical protein
MTEELPGKPGLDKASRLVLFGLAVLLAIGIWSIFRRNSAGPDFKCFYAAALAANQGLNPYDPAECSRVFHEENLLPFVYPPFILSMFRPIAWIGFQASLTLFFTLKVCALGALLYLWNRIFDVRRHLVLFLLALLFGFNGALACDLHVENISIFEEVLIWLGFYSYLRGRIILFAAFILAAAAFKLAPILLLGLLATKLRRRELICMVLFGLLFLAYLGLNRFLWPQWFDYFNHNARTVAGTRASNSPTTWAFIRDAADWLQQKRGFQVPVPALVGIYAVMSLAAMAVSWVAFMKLRRSATSEADVWRICLMCLLYALVVPRFMRYSWLLVIGPAFFVVVAQPKKNLLIPVCGFLLIFSYRGIENLSSTLLGSLGWMASDYQCIFAAWLLWALCFYSILRRGQIAQSDLATSQPAPA